ncbi:MAG: DUF3108 domain-containing protein [Candidatus Eisenbacteria bacterium]|nr:DUF3108 domain-containing protein [Candidatus Eisenbacteria bacterium]
MTRGTACALFMLVLLAAAAPVRGTQPALGPDGSLRAPPFGVGERMTFDLTYGFITAGKAVMSIPSTEVVSGYPCYHIVSIAESVPWFSTFFRVRDVAESHLDVRELVTRRFEKSLSEGDYRAHDLVLYDQERHIAVYPERDGRVVPLSLDAQDILTSLYYVRMMDLEVGTPVFIENHADKKNYPLRIDVLERDRISVPAGTFDCIVVEPVMRVAGLFRHKGSLRVWLTDDDRHVPVLMRSKVVIGSISAELTSYTPPQSWSGAVGEGP